MSKLRRPYQDWVSWQNFGTLRFWQEVRENPGYAGELVLQRLCKGGLVNPAETTSASLATGILVATHGPQGCPLLPDAEVDRCYDWVKAHHNFRQKVHSSPCAVTTARGLIS